VCPQAVPVWFTDIAPIFLVDYLTGQQFAGSTNISSYGYTPAPLDPRTTEDCLFLDVLTPQEVFESGKGAPVVVWIFGGGFTEGDKSLYNGSSLVLRSLLNGGEGVIFVAINYRVSFLYILSSFLSFFLLSLLPSSFIICFSVFQQF
jgi:hypothetical protein